MEQEEEVAAPLLGSGFGEGDAAGVWKDAAPPSPGWGGGGAGLGGAGVPWDSR